MLTCHVAYGVGPATGAQFDVVVSSEVVEHVSDVPGFVAACGAMVKVSWCVQRQCKVRARATRSLIAVTRAAVVAAHTAGRGRGVHDVEPHDGVTCCGHHAR